MARLHRPDAALPSATEPPPEWLERQIHRYRYVAPVDPREDGPFCSVQTARAKALAQWERKSPESRQQCHEAERQKEQHR